LQKEQGKAKQGKAEQGAIIVASEEVLYKFDVSANRNDLLCVEGFARALKVFLGGYANKLN